MKGVVSSAAGRPERGRHRQRRLTRNSGVLVEKIARTKFLEVQYQDCPRRLIFSKSAWTRTS